MPSWSSTAAAVRHSALATDSLMKVGYSNVFPLVGGLGTYEKAVLLTEKPAK